MKTSYHLILALFLALTGFGKAAAQSYVPLYGETRMAVSPAIPIKAYPLPLNDVRLLDGPFKTAMEADRKWLLSLQPDRFLHRFHQNAGFPTKGAMYGGWEDSTQSGFCFGHYISAMSMLYAASGDPLVLEQLEYSISELRRCQEARGTGYVDAIPGGDKLWNDILAGNMELTGSGWINGIWVPWYNLHKLWAGLVDAYLYTGNETAKTIVVDLTNWACDKFKDFSAEGWQKMLYCETGGMNDALYNVYAITGDARHLELAEKFYHKLVLDPLSEQRDELAGFHANTQIPKITGAARSYELQGKQKDKTISTYFWETVIDDHSYCIGGNSNHEHFEEPGKNTLSNRTTETCNTYNMLKLTRHLFAWEPTARYADYYERALYNHILASQNPETGMIVYYLPLAYNSFKEFSTPEESFYCCVGTGFENHVKYAEHIYSENESELYINLFIASELDWKRQNMKVKQETSFPDTDKTTLTITASAPRELTFHIRYPEWATEGYTLRINGQAQAVTTTPGSYISIKRTWSDGDKIEIDMVKSLHKELLLGDEHKTAFLNGPIVLAGELDPMEERTVVLLEEDKDLNTWIKPTDVAETQFRTQTGYPADVNLIPFYKKYKGNYAVYFDTYSPDEWAAVKEEYEKEEERLRELERLTVDYFRPNEQQQEIDHKFTGTNISRGDGAYGKKWCDSDGGYFSFEMKVSPDYPVGLLLTYWGSDGGNRKFDILVDDVVFATEELTGDKPNEFFDRTYPIPFHLTKGKDMVIIKLRAHSGNKAGGIFFARTLKKKEMAENITVTDYLLPGDPYVWQHDFQQGGNRGKFKGYPWIEAREGNTSSFTMKSSATNPMSLLLTYWGGEEDKRTFDILIDNNLIASQELLLNKPGDFFDVAYDIPSTLSLGKESLRVGLKGTETSKAGGMFYAYTFSQGSGSSISTIEADKGFPFIIGVADSRIHLRNSSYGTLRGLIAIYSTYGQLLCTQAVQVSEQVAINKVLDKGIYVLRFSPEDEVACYTAKVVVA